MITSEKSDNNYFPASSEFSHIVAELEKYIENPEESSLTFDFKITSYLTPWLTQFAYWAYSYSRNCITIKLLNKDLRVYNNVGVKSEDNFILLDDIKLFALTLARLGKFNTEGFVEQEICDYILNKIKNKPKELILSTSSVKSRLRSNYISLKQIQKGDLSQSDLDKLETEIVEYLSKIFVIDPIRLRFTPEMIVPLKIADLKTVFPNFEERLVDKIASSILGVNVNNCKKLKTGYNLSDDFLKLCLRNYSNKITSKE